MPPADTSSEPSAPASSPLRILGRANSFNVRKVLWMCDEIGLAYTREDYGRGYRPTDTPQFLRLNPAGQVPVVIDGDVVLRESNTIVRYLAAKHGAEDLYPPDLVERARVEQWMDWTAYDVTPALRGAFLGGQLQQAPWNHPWFVERGRMDLTGLMRLLDAHLEANGPHVAAERLTVADIPVGLVVNRWFMLEGLDRPPLASLAAYYDLLGEREPYRRHGRNGLP